MHGGAIFFIAASIILRRKNRRDKAQAYRKRNEYEMVGHRYRELNSREQRHVKQRIHFLTPLVSLLTCYQLDIILDRAKGKWNTN